MLAPRVTFFGGVAVVMDKTQPAAALKGALRAAQRNADNDDRAFILRWITQVDDQAFEDLVTDLIAHSEIGDDLYVTCATVISLALGARHAATELRHGVDGMSGRMQGEIAELRQMAQKADDLASFCRGPGKRDLASLMSPQVRLGPLIKQHGLMPLQDLAELHEREPPDRSDNWLRRTQRKTELAQADIASVD